MTRIAAAMNDLNREATLEAARREPGLNIELGLRLGDAALALATHHGPRPDPVAPITIWRALKRRPKP
ncbi:MAG: hypothetical protein JNM17_29210 [Archangium sp.]|nr:hypothetical protein [Archangium sp.]